MPLASIKVLPTFALNDVSWNWTLVGWMKTSWTVTSTKDGWIQGKLFFLSTDVKELRYE